MMIISITTIIDVLVLPRHPNPQTRYDNFDAQEDRGAYNSSAYAYDGATFGTGGIGGTGGGDPDVGGIPQQADL